MLHSSISLGHDPPFQGLNLVTYIEANYVSDSIGRAHKVPTCFGINPNYLIKFIVRLNKSHTVPGTNVQQRTVCVQVIHPSTVSSRRTLVTCSELIYESR